MPTLKIMSGPQSGSSIPVAEAVVIGRSHSAGLSFDEKTLSRLHARLEPIEGEWRLTDLGSSNGSFVNGRAVRTGTVLHDGDTVRLGNFTFAFRLDPAGVPALNISLDTGAEKAPIIENVSVDDHIGQLAAHRHREGRGRAGDPAPAVAVRSGRDPGQCDRGRAALPPGAREAAGRVPGRRARLRHGLRPGRRQSESGRGPGPPGGPEPDGGQPFARPAGGRHPQRCAERRRERRPALRSAAHRRAFRPAHRDVRAHGLRGHRARA